MIDQEKLDRDKELELAVEAINFHTHVATVYVMLLVAILNVFLLFNLWIAVNISREVLASCGGG